MIDLVVILNDCVQFKLIFANRQQFTSLAVNTQMNIFKVFSNITPSPPLKCLVHYMILGIFTSIVKFR